MSNNTPPCACLADFGFTTMAFGPGGRWSRSAQVESDMVFMAPELLMPKEFQKEDGIPTPQADIYAFGMVIFQVCEQEHKYRPLLTFCRSFRVKSHSVVFNWGN